MVIVETRSGQSLSETVIAPLGSESRPLEDAMIDRKLRALISQSNLAISTDILTAEVRDLHQAADVRKLMAALVPGAED